MYQPLTAIDDQYMSEPTPDEEEAWRELEKRHKTQFNISNDLRQGRDTPCVGVCNLLFAEVCQGCGRTVMEESNWTAMTPQEKDAVWARILTQGWQPGKGIQK